MYNVINCLTGISRAHTRSIAHGGIKQARHLSTFETGQTVNPGLHHKPQPSELSEDGARSLRVRKYGGKSLPLPPFMDPLKVEKKMRHRTPKAHTDTIAPNELTQFQKELASNPHAHALATPIRQCAITMARLPSHFLLPFTIKFTPNPESTPSEPKKPSTHLAYVASKPDGAGLPTSYLSSRRIMMSHANTKDNWELLFTERLKVRYGRKMQRNTSKLRNKDTHKLVEWDKMMPTIVVRGLREDVLREMDACRGSAEAPNEAADVLVRLDDEQRIDAQNLACVLHLGTEFEPDGHYTCLRAFDLRDLDLSEPVKERLSFGALCGVVKSSRTMRLLLALDRLEAYIKS